MDQSEETEPSMYVHQLYIELSILGLITHPYIYGFCGAWKEYIEIKICQIRRLHNHMMPIKEGQ